VGQNWANDGLWVAATTAGCWDVQAIAMARLESDHMSKERMEEKQRGFAIFQKGSKI
jgi:hypothetical protein